MKKRRNYLIIREGKENERALNINNILSIQPRGSGTKIYMVEETSYDIEEKYNDVLDMLLEKLENEIS